MLRMFVAALRMYRDGPLLLGEIRSLGGRVLARGHRSARASVPGGRSILASVKTAVASPLLNVDGRAEVLVLASPDERTGCIIAIRPTALEP